MRITGGAAKGTRLRTLPGAQTRPTADEVRKAIFDILGGDVEGSRVMDLFAGSGALGIEALSRGAAHALFVESSARACSVIEDNLDSSGFGERATVRRADVSRFVSGRARCPVGLCFLDPPYARGIAFVARVLEKLDSGGWIRAGGTVVVEHPVGTVAWPAPFRPTRSRRSGRTQVSLAVRVDA